MADNKTYIAAYWVSSRSQGRNDIFATVPGVGQYAKVVENGEPCVYKVTDVIWNDHGQTCVYLHEVVGAEAQRVLDLPEP